MPILNLWNFPPYKKLTLWSKKLLPQTTRLKHNSRKLRRKLKKKVLKASSETKTLKFSITKTKPRT